MKEGERFTLVLSSTLDESGQPSDGTFDASGEPSLADKYEYVTTVTLLCVVCHSPPCAR